MNNWRTTVLGYAVIVAAAIALVTKFLKGEPVSLDEMIAVVAAFGGGAIGINAKDGGH